MAKYAPDFWKNNKMDLSSSLETSGVWGKLAGGGGGGTAPPPGSPTGGAGDTSYASYQGLLAMAKLHAANQGQAAAVKGTCKRCGGAGHLTFQCRNHLAPQKKSADPTIASPFTLKGAATIGTPTGSTPTGQPNFPLEMPSSTSSLTDDSGDEPDEGARPTAKKEDPTPAPEKRGIDKTAEKDYYDKHYGKEKETKDREDDRRRPASSRSRSSRERGTMKKGREDEEAMRRKLKEKRRRSRSSSSSSSSSSSESSASRGSRSKKHRRGKSKEKEPEKKKRRRSR